MSATPALLLSAGVAVILGAIAVSTSRVRIQTGVCALSVLDPLRVAGDSATIDQLSRGTGQLVVGKGNELRQLPTSGVASGEQRDQLAEKYELLRRLWREENVTWQGKFRGPLDSLTSPPRLYAGEPRSWHGSATTLTSAAHAAKWGDTLSSASAIQPRASYKVLIDHYRAGYVRTDTILGTPTSVPALVPSSSPAPPRRPGRATGRSTSRWWK